VKIIHVEEASVRYIHPKPGAKRVKLKSRNQVLLLLISTIFFLTGCMSPVEEFIQGTWYYDEEHLHRFIAESALEIYWTFDGGYFAYDACCFNTDEHITGQYRVLDETEDSITIEIYNVKGSGTRYGGQYKIIIDRETDTLNILGGGPYYRVTAQE
jgi:hypothetical protein